MAKWIVTLDVTVEADSRESAFEKVEALLISAESFCLYDAETVELVHEADPSSDGETDGAGLAEEVESADLPEAAA